MSAQTPSSTGSLVMLTAAIFLAPTADPVSARERPPTTLEIEAGSMLFADDGVVTEGFGGGAVRFYLLPTISVGPEVAYVRGKHHSHLIFTGNVTFDLLRPVSGRARLVTPFAVVGGGLFQTREKFPNGSVFTSTEPAFTAGGGVRARVGKNLVMGAEARIGWELHIRLNGFVGMRLGH